MWNMSWAAVLLAAVAGFAIGAIWYGPLFGTVWQREADLSDEKLRDANRPLIFGVAFVLTLFASFILGHVLATYGRPGIMLSVLVSSGLAGGFIVPAIGVNYLFARKSVKLFLIDGGYWYVVFTAMGLVFGAFA